MLKNNIAEIRAELSLTQEELAKKTNISRVALSAIENGRVPNGNTMFKIAKALNKKVEDVFSEECVNQE